MATRPHTPGDEPVEVIDLTFLGTGYRQHAFTRTDEPDSGWVYKIPAAFGYILPYRHRPEAIGPITSFKKAIVWLLLGFPSALHQKLVAPALERMRRLGLPWIANGLASVVSVIGAARDRLFMAHARRARKRNFEEMLALMDVLERHDLGHVVPSFAVIRNGAARLRVGDRVLSYRGPILQQQRIQTFFNKDRLADFRWADVVAAQHALWKHGFAVTERGEALGYRSWALVDGRVVLADTSSLTRDLKLARRTLRPQYLDVQEQIVLNAPRDSAATTAFRQYFEYLRREVNMATLDALWRTALRPTATNGPTSSDAAGHNPPGRAPRARKGSLTHQTVTGMLWAAGGKGTNSVLSTIVLVILARLLAPADFGTVSAAMVVIGFSSIFSRLGLGPAIVQFPKLERRHLQTAFTVSLWFGALVGAIIWFLAPVAAAFFRNPHVAPVLHALALIFPLKGFSVVAEAVMRRELRFRWLATRAIVSYGIGFGVIGIVLAFMGAGVWALVGAQFAQSLVGTALLLSAVRPSFRWWPEPQAFRELVRFGGGHTAAKVANYFALQGDYMVVGRWLGAAALGLYERAYVLMTVPASLLGTLLDDVLFPTMARAQGDPRRLTLAYRRGVALIALAILPTSAVLMVLGPEVFRVALGAKWLEAVVPFQIFTAGMLFRTSYKMSDALARATGAVYRRAWRQAVYATLVIGGAWIGQHWGISGVAVAVTVALVVNFLLMAHLSLGMVNLTWGALAALHRPALALAAGCGLVAWAAASPLRFAGAPAFAVLLVAGGVTFTCAVLVMRYAPALFLGRDGQWVLDVAQSYVPARFVPWRTPTPAHASSQDEASASGVGTAGASG